jgi:hypothetical protein
MPRHGGAAHWKRLLLLAVICLPACSTAPVADILDYFSPGKLGQEKTAPYGGVCVPPAAGSNPAAVPAPAIGAVPSPMATCPTPAPISPPPQPAAPGVGMLAPVAPPPATLAGAPIPIPQDSGLPK